MSAHPLAILQSLILISAANGAPVLFARLLGARFAHPIDGGIVLRDGHPLLGRSKTWRGLAAAILLAACAAVLIRLPWQLGALAAASAMAGDCLSSFVKRREKTAVLMPTTSPWGSRLRPPVEDSAFGATHFRGHFCVHCRYGPVNSSSSRRETLSIGFRVSGFPPPCYPNYGASDSCPGRPFSC